MSDEQKLRDAADSVGLSHISEELVKLLKPSIYIKPTRASDETELPIGASKFGGQPDLPVGESWVRWGDVPLTFLAQINLSEIHAFDETMLLPSTGILYFFLYTVDYWENDTKPASWRVIYRNTEQSQLRRVSFPSDDIRPEEWEWAKSFPACKLEFSLERVIPDYADVRIRLIQEQLSSTEKSYNLYSDLRGRLQHNIQRRRSHLLGYADIVQDDVGIYCQTAYNKVFRFVALSSMDDPIKAASNWRILLQIDSEKEADMMWGDAGRLYFCIKEEDLQDRRFDKVWMIFQCY